MRALVIFLCLLAGPGHAGPSITTLWKARALEAMDRLEKAAKGDVGTPNAYKRYELLLEAAFAFHLSTPDVVQKPYDGDGNGFHLLIKTGSGEGDGSQLFDIVYLYSADGTPSGVRVDMLPKGWKVLVQPHLEAGLIQIMQRRNAVRGTPSAATPRPITIGTDDAILVFDAMDPFSPFVLQSALEELDPQPAPPKAKVRPTKAPVRKPSPLDEVDPP